MHYASVSTARLGDSVDKLLIMPGINVKNGCANNPRTWFRGLVLGQCTLYTDIEEFNCLDRQYLPSYRVVLDSYVFSGEGFSQSAS